MSIKDYVNMDIKEMVKDAHKNAIDHGFWEEEKNILTKMCVKEFEDEEIKAVKRAFMCQRLMLIVSEVSEAVNALRKDDKENYAEELADIILRTSDTALGDTVDIEKEIKKKMKKNRNRPYKHGKAF
ncbi:MazG nucleotide pyrophosphohydrolase domain-containing protein [Clostridium botulinum]|uniref:Nucleotide pyrophosphohydrolase n=1 Tax=Clostridium botulinum TaxID=1491 RepID=A0A846I0U6_CLOBO|nr:MazG nucleotide pyrophosphohydrolase domain-containing protein [Clostridium botulinum]AJE09840.1 mazG nucleotide pyrophosphohydrolase domain protein [Clostridium botulinum CDC_1436]AJE13142.1 mazG nucleotide pyrophosphohydrolase domain protein [Clostridium botulinum CDC_1436]MCR1166757.1 nucleotide pyrophosphohydrolase [Clostridium botulinum]NEZ91834.1 nucleotide pyrophosphohydrolase [Clostridium botulinum]